MKTYNNLLHEYKADFIANDINLETIKAYLFELCNERDIDLYLNLDKEASEEFIEVFDKGIKRILNNEPMNYVLGYCYFFGYKLVVDQRVLIPRYETEELIGRILSYIDDYYAGYKEISLADVATGSGAIAIALAKEEPKLKVFASDISGDAIDVAKKNALNNDCKIEFMIGNMLDPLIEKGIKLDILVSNPPYIPSLEQLENSVKDFEPHVALFGGEDGLKYYKEIFSKAHYLLNDGGMMAFEIGYNQKLALEALARSYFKSADIKIYQDINGKDRMMFIKL